MSPQLDGAESAQAGTVPEPSGPGPKVGARIRELRRARKLTLAQLAGMAGISIGTLSQVERERVSPTVRTLFSLGAALGVAPAWLLDSPDESDNDAPYIIRADRRQPLIDAAGLRKDLVSSTASRHLKGLYVSLDPGASSGSDFYVHRGEEIGFVVAGMLELKIQERTFMLHRGDSFSFPSDLPHRFSNPGPSQSIVFWVNCDVDTE
ncbi:helix-turn-helix domain-containing protein [Pseudomonas typographi]|uniref:Cupin domain-containing protein n=1 Tax=Pseudomonas typographi TaxID=2715964 RepID=A0ABR7Z7K3_9PSED|nr:cupin domain-containing protein [Pseudomonas typographi]MBD1551167.1 cupin domain-containing protein [Pseudomonas typographi]MBD1586339.1 cupin domain-containing protein [Pseudomonas typographi]MBD1601298.1 cupin domain-containing protein [Pseudomonas typographi]